jgi:hypothetical protein
MSSSVNNEKVLISGFLLDLDCPSEERLAAHVDLTQLAGYNHIDWVGAFQDLLRSIDVQYRLEKLPPKETKTKTQQQFVEEWLRRGRSIRVRYVKDPQGQQRKVASFQPYPNLLVNRLKELRRKVYEALNENCLILQEERIGKQKRKLYFLPANFATEIMLHVEELNALLETLKVDVAEFEASSKFDAIKAHIKATGVELTAPARSLSAIRISPVPLCLSKEFFGQYLEEEKKKAVLAVNQKKTQTLTELEERRQRGLSALEAEVKRKRQAMLDALQHDLQTKFASTISLAETLVKSILRGERSTSKAATKQYTKFVELVESVGVEYDTKPFRALSNLFGATETKDPTALSCAVGELAASLGIRETGDTLRDMELSAKVARGESLLLFTIE